MKTAAIAAAAPFAGAAALGQSTGKSSGKKLGVALCGLGGLSTNQLAPALAKTERCHLAGIVTGTPQKAAQWKAQYGIPDRSIYNYDTMHRMADNPDIDIVYVVTPNALHLEHATKAAAAGKHVFCEKPLEITVERCQRIIDACNKADRMLGVAYRCQFEPHNLECMRIAREKELGTVKIIESGFGFPIGDPNQWRLEHALAGGGALMDVGVYVVQAARYLAGEEPILVSAIETKTDPKKFKEVDEAVTWTMKFPSGAVAYCGTTYSAFGMHHFNVYTDRGAFGLKPAFFYGGIKGFRSDGKPIEFPQIDQFAAEMDDFARCVQDGVRTKVPGEEGLQDVRIMTAIYESIRTGKEVALA